MNASPLGKRFALAAANLIGVPFRLHGRDPSKGLDCIGLVHAALVAIDRRPIAPEGYRLRNSDPSRWLGYAELSGFQKSTGELMIGDIVLIEPGMGQLHLIIADGTGQSVHAHAGLGRVVREPIPIRTAPLAQWRLF